MYNDTRESSRTASHTHRRWVLSVLAAAMAVAISAPAAAEAEFTPIFDGESLDGWIGMEEVWRVEDGHIIGETTDEEPLEQNTFLIWDEGEADDFELRFRYRIDTPWANSGVQVRSVHEGDYVVAGPQPDIATDDWITGIHYEERGRGIMARRGERTVVSEDGEMETERFADEDELGEHIHDDDWNEYRVVAQGDTITTIINGETMNEVVDHSPEARRSGIIAFQLHTGDPMKIRFADVELKRLPLEDKRKVVFVAGEPSHGYGNHAHRAGCILLADLLNENTDDVLATVYTGGWPADPTAFDNADAVVLFSNGGPGHMILPHMDEFEEVMERGVGLGALHFAVEVPPGDAGDRFVQWIGGYFETHWSVNPFWTAEIDEIPEHEVTEGVEPFEMYDEWYYHMRFSEHTDNLQPIFSDLPPEETLDREDGPHSNNPHVREAVLEREEPQHVMWLYERSEMPGRGFGMTGGHYHWNWGHPSLRTAVLNAIVWIAGAEVPEGGVPTPVLTMEDFEVNLDYDVPDDFDRDEWKQRIEEWQADHP